MAGNERGKDMAIERLVYECSKNGIEKDASGGQVYSYTKGMKKYLEDPQIGIERLESYEQPVDFESDFEKNIAPLSYTYNQMETLFPKQFRYQIYKKPEKTIFGMSNNCVSLDWNNYKDYNTYLQIRGDGNEIVSGRGGAYEFCLFAGDDSEIEDYPICYYCSNSLKNPYTPEDFCNGAKPGYMQPLLKLQSGNRITLESVREFILEECDRAELLKKMLYALLHYRADSNRSYNRNLVICDGHENISYWVGAITMLFSVKLAKSISFSTYEYSPIGCEYRICGAFPVGTDYNPNNQNKGSFIFDCWNFVFEDIDFGGHKSFYDFLVASLLYKKDNLSEFYDFADKFQLNDVGADLEGLYHLYEFIRGNREEKLSVADAKQVICFVKDCCDDILVERIFVQIINYYITLGDEDAAAYGTLLRDVMEGRLAVLEPLQNRCAHTLVFMLKSGSRMNVKEIQIVYRRYRNFFGYAGLDFENAFYLKLFAEADTVVANNSNVSYNIYFANIIISHVIKEGREYYRLESKCREGALLHCAVGNIFSLDLSNAEFAQIVQSMLDPVRDDIEGYLFLLRLIGEMVDRCHGDVKQMWPKVSEIIFGQLVADAEQSDSPEDNLQMLLKNCDRYKDEKLFFTLLQKLTDFFDLANENIDSKLLQDIEEICKRNHIAMDYKLEICKLLEELKSDCQLGKRKLNAKYSKKNMHKKEKYRLLELPEQQLNVFLKRYAGYVAEIYIVCEDLAIIGYYNGLLELDRLLEKEIAGIEIRLGVKMVRGNIGLLADMIGFSASFGPLIDEQELADILLKGHINTSKLNKYINERSRSIMEHVKENVLKDVNLKEDVVNLQNYWEQVYRIIEGKHGGIVNRIVKSSFPFLRR